MQKANRAPTTLKTSFIPMHIPYSKNRYLNLSATCAIALLCFGKRNKSK
jgi:hypothetical protein